MRLLNLFPVFFIFLLSCGDKEPAPEPVAGKGGNATLNVTCKHHGKVIDSITVYIKYNVQDKPSGYDDSAKAMNMNNSSIAKFEGLKAGKYYLYGRGWDNSIGEVVEGGIPYIITEEKSIDITVPVTEGD